MDAHDTQPPAGGEGVLHATSYSTPLIALDAVALDTETTGIDARSARLIQIAAIPLAGGRMRPDDGFDRLVNPGVPIPASSVAIHGITDARVADAPPFGEIAGLLEAYIGRAIAIGYAVAYDLAVLEREYTLAGRPMPHFRALDVRTLARIAAPSLADHSLEALCGWLGISLRGRHTAIGDARAAGEVFQALIPLLRAKDIRTLAEAEAAARALAERDATAAAASYQTAAQAPVDARPVLARIDSFPYRHRVSDVMSAPAVFADAGTTVREAMRTLIDRRISSVFVRLPSEETGIVTERDLLRAIDAGGEAALSQPIGPIAKAPLQTLPEDAFLYRAIGRIERLGFRHLGVTDAAGQIVGAVTTRNLLGHRATTAIVLGDAIDSATADAQLAAAWGRLTLMAKSLMQEQVGPLTICSVVSAEICALTRRAAELAEDAMRAEGLGPPPVPYAVLVLGSAGRGESQLAADQDNAIVYAEGAEGGPEDRYFEQLGIRMTETLDAAGVPLCKGGVMARNRAWRKSVADWHATIDKWMTGERATHLLNVDIFFDCVPVHGEASLGETVWSHAYDRAHGAIDFQNLLVETARARDNPFTFFGRFRTDETGRIDVKKYGLMPIFTAARVLSIRHDVRARSTAERLRGVAAKGRAPRATVEAVIEAQRTLLATVIGQQLADTEVGVPLSTRVATDRLDKAHRARLRSALRAVDGALELVSEGRV
jgi:DNA polymerase-3 subunit epsilon/CBS domain-containing protein